MFEESNSNINPASPRMKACLRQCRLAKYMAGGTIFDGSCPCERPNECRFGLTPELKYITMEDVFVDIREYWKQAWDE